MVAFALALIIAGAAAGEAPAKDACSIGKAVLAGLPALDGPGAESHYLSSDGIDHGASLFKHCPGLLHALPGNFQIATTDALRRASVHAPPFQHPTAVVVFVGMPKESKDRRSATVTIAYTCSGLCGAEFDVHYQRRGAAWEQSDEPTLRWVS